MKKILETLILLAILFLIMAGSGETPDGGIDLPWTLGAIVLIALLSIVLVLLQPKKEDKCYGKSNLTVTHD